MIVQWAAVREEKKGQWITLCRQSDDCLNLLSDNWMGNFQENRTGSKGKQLTNLHLHVISQGHRDIRSWVSSGRRWAKQFFTHPDPDWIVVESCPVFIHSGIVDVAVKLWCFWKFVIKVYNKSSSSRFASSVSYHQLNFISEIGALWRLRYEIHNSCLTIYSNTTKFHRVNSRDAIMVTNGQAVIY